MVDVVRLGGYHTIGVFNTSWGSGWRIVDIGDDASLRYLLIWLLFVRRYSIGTSRLLHWNRGRESVSGFREGRIRFG